MIQYSDGSFSKNLSLSNVLDLIEKEFDGSTFKDHGKIPKAIYLGSEKELDQKRVELMEEDSLKEKVEMIERRLASLEKLTITSDVLYIPTKEEIEPFLKDSTCEEKQ